MPVDFRFPFSEPVQVGSIDDANLLHEDRIKVDRGYPQIPNPD